MVPVLKVPVLKGLVLKEVGPILKIVAPILTIVVPVLNWGQTMNCPQSLFRLTGAVNLAQ